jgi:hypothetical protein
VARHAVVGTYAKLAEGELTEARNQCRVISRPVVAHLASAAYPNEAITRQLRERWECSLEQQLPIRYKCL